MKLADAFEVSMDVFRDDATRLDLPHPNFAKNDFISEENIPFRFGSNKPTLEQTSVLDFCNIFLNELPDCYFVKGVGQNSEYGTGRYFWENKIDLLMFIGLSPKLIGNNKKYQYSVCINTETQLSNDILSKYNCLQITDNENENWIYVSFDWNEPNMNLRIIKAKEALLTVMKIAREVLYTIMDKFQQGE